ncbi:MAG: AMP-binding protein [Anaerolineales bacterium]|nr:AMP-binding protein [Anaerolineales bacterium]
MYTDLFTALANRENLRGHPLLAALLYAFCPAAARWWLAGAEPVIPFDPVWQALQDFTLGKTLKEVLSGYGFENLLGHAQKYIRNVDVDTGKKVLGPGEVGELCMRGPQVMKGYWNMPTETANVLRRDPQGGDPWLYTGDIATMDEDGYFRIVDHKKDMILGAGGENIYPRDIEDVLYEHPKVLEAAAIGIPLPGKGERVKVFIRLKEGQTATAEEIIAFCKENLAAYKVPRYVEFREQLPKTIVGKILRRELVKEEAERQKGEATVK